MHGQNVDPTGQVSDRIWLGWGRVVPFRYGLLAQEGQAIRAMALADLRSFIQKSSKAPSAEDSEKNGPLAGFPRISHSRASLLIRVALAEPSQPLRFSAFCLLVSASTWNKPSYPTGGSPQPWRGTGKNGAY
jgi:hypothetical protein